jgi:hypothetical protein
MKAKLLFISFLQAFLLFSSAFARNKPCNQCNDLTIARKQACETECEIFYQKNPEARPSNRDGVCETPIEKLRAQFSPLKKLNQAIACAEGAWTGVLSVPDQIRAYIKMAEEVSDSFSKSVTEHNELVRQCQADIKCKIDLAKELMRFEKASNDEDPRLIEYAKNTHALQIMQNLEREKLIRKETCSRAFGNIRQEIFRDFEKEKLDSTALLAKVYDRLAEQSPDCPSRLGLENRRKQVLRPNASPQTPTWLETIGVKLQCYNSEKLAELFCLELTSFVLDPLNLAIGGGFYLKALKTAGIRKTAANELDLAKPTEFPTRRKPENFANRNQFVQSYLNREFTTEAQNLAWMDAARTTQPDGKYVFLDIENSRLKFLNDSLKDKDLVTALTNRHKEIVLQKLDELKKKYPNLEILEYSDFKSLRFAIKQPAPRDLQNEFNQILIESNKLFREEMISKGVLRTTDDAQNWFRAGIGETADQANTAARFSRTQPEARLESFNTPELKTYFKNQLAKAEELRSSLSKSPAADTLFETVNQGTHRIPKREVFDSVRKFNNPLDVQKDIEVRFGQKLPIEEAKNLAEYVKIVDSFTPGIHVAKREIVTAKNASRGAISMDFTGMGAYNLRETALALTRSKKLEEALEQTRLAEKRVTQMFQRRMNEKINLIDNFLGQKKNLPGIEVRCSGDDCVGIFPDRITPKDQRDLVQRFSRSDFPAGIRVSFITERVKAPEMRNTLATHGEAIEKQIRKNLAGKIPDSALNNLTFGVVMSGDEVGKGSVQLLVGNSRQPLNAIQMSEIKAAFKTATQKLNEDMTKELRRPIKYEPLSEFP